MVGCHRTVGNLIDQCTADKDVVDQFTAAAVNTREMLILGDAGGEVPQALTIATVRLGVPTGADLRSGRPLQQLGGRSIDRVIEITQHDHRCVTIGGEDRCGGRADRRRLRCRRNKA